MTGISPPFDGFFNRDFKMLPFIKTLGSLKKANLFGLMIACAILGCVVVLSLVGIITWSAAHLIHIETGWLDTLVNWIVGIVTGIGGWFMLPAIIVLIAGVFQEKTIHQVEQAYYPEKMRKQGPRLWPDLMHDIRFTFWAVLLNILVLPFYFFGIGFIVSIDKQKDFSGKRVEKIIQNACFSIRENVEAEINFQTFAEENNIGYSYFRKMFKKYTGVPPVQYHLDLKVLRAKEMLLYTDKSIKEISYELGFQSIYYFSRVFKNKLGLSPSEIRKSVTS